MEFNVLTIVIVTIVATIATAGAATIFMKIRKDNPEGEFKDNFGSAWVKIRPILSELFINIFNIYQADKGGFDELLDFSVKYVKDKIDASDFLLPEEKELFTDEFLRSILEPKLRELYEKEAELY